MADDLAKQPLNDMPYADLHMLCKQHGYHNRDARPLAITRKLAMEQMARECAREVPEIESSAAKKCSLLAVLRFASGVEEAVVTQHGQ